MKNVAKISKFKMVALLGIWGLIWGPTRALKWLDDLEKSRKTSFFELEAPNWAPNIF